MSSESQSGLSRLVNKAKYAAAIGAVAVTMHPDAANASSAGTAPQVEHPAITAHADQQATPKIPEVKNNTEAIRTVVIAGIDDIRTGKYSFVEGMNKIFQDMAKVDPNTNATIKVIVSGEGSAQGQTQSFADTFVFIGSKHKIQSTDFKNSNGQAYFNNTDSLYKIFVSTIDGGSFSYSVPGLGEQTVEASLKFKSLEFQLGLPGNDNIYDKVLTISDVQDSNTNSATPDATPINKIPIVKTPVNNISTPSITKTPEPNHITPTPVATESAPTKTPTPRKTVEPTASPEVSKPIEIHLSTPGRTQIELVEGKESKPFQIYSPDGKSLGFFEILMKKSGPELVTFDTNTELPLQVIDTNTLAAMKVKLSYTMVGGKMVVQFIQY